MIKNQKIIKYFILMACVFSLIVITLGAYTRLVHAGLGCPDWPLCYGHAWAPSSTSDIASANLQFPEIPVNLTKTWPEMTHRYLATSLGLLCIIICYLAVRARRYESRFPVKHSFFLLFFVILQGMFGMWTVTLKLWPQVVTLHLLGGFTTFCLLLLLYARSSVLTGVDANVASKTTSNAPQFFPLKLLAAAALVIVVIQIVLGGWITSNYAALACVELPWCDISKVTLDDTLAGFNILQEIGPNYLGGQLDAGARIAIHMGHRIGALCTSLVLLALIVLLFKQRYQRLSIVLGGLLTLQVILGLSNVYFYLPLANAVAHNLVGALLLGAVVWINWAIHRPVLAR